MIVPVLREVSTVEGKMRVSEKLNIELVSYNFKKTVWIKKLNRTNVQYFKRLTSWHN